MQNKFIFFCMLCSIWYTFDALLNYPFFKFFLVLQVTTVNMVSWFCLPKWGNQEHFHNIKGKDFKSPSPLNQCCKNRETEKIKNYTYFDNQRYWLKGGGDFSHHFFWLIVWKQKQIKKWNGLAVINQQFLKTFFLVNFWCVDFDV